jgi:hypothetical protein
MPISSTTKEKDCRLVDDVHLTRGEKLFIDSFVFM